jgi:hypothetical protein
MKFRGGLRLFSELTEPGLIVTAFGASTMDETYMQGPETLSARASAILCGSIAGCDKQIVSTSKPPGPDAIPLKWMVKGRVDDPVALKGSVLGAVSFSRMEQSPFLPGERERERWELEYGDLDARGRVILFFSDERTRAISKAIPSGAGERDLIALVRDVVAIQARPAAEAQTAWLSYLLNARFDQGKKAALRTLVRERTPWQQLQPVIERLMGDAKLSTPMREFAFGIVVIGLRRDRWQSDPMSVVDFLCRQFGVEADRELLLLYILQLKLLLHYASQEAERAAWAPALKRTADCLRRRESALSAVPELAEEYRELRAAHPGLF